MVKFRMLRYIYALLLPALSVLLLSCGPRPETYGVVLWSPEGSSIESGAVVAVFSESRLNETYNVGVIPEERGRPEPQEELATWRVRIFEEMEDASAYAEGFAEHSSQFVRSEQETGVALPVRAEPNPTGDIVYRLRRGEVMKVLDRAEEPTDLAGLVDYWYEVLTEGGTTGHVFGYYLAVLEEGAGSEGLSGADRDQDPFIESFLSRVWRPVDFVNMLDSGHINLETFRPDIGLFPNPAEQRIRLNLLTHSLSFDYTDFYRAGPRQYIAEGTSLQVTRNRENEVSIQYSLEGSERSIYMHHVPRDIGAIAESERARRESVYRRLIEPGRILESSAYGTIELFDNRRFRWTGYEALVPNVIAAGLGEEGRIDLGLFIANELESNYTGAFRMVFDGIGDREDAPAFLYTLTETGLRIAFVPPQNITENVVLAESLSPVVIFFSYRQ